MFDITTVPAAAFGPVTRAMLADYAAASGDNNPLHLSDTAAQQAGFHEVIAQGMLSMAFVGRWVTSWCPLHAVQSISSRFTAPTPLGSHLRCEGRIRSVENDSLTVDYTVTLEGSNVITLKGAVVVKAD
ncbi:MaoC/PaaZ C-terminal domain-containing protein [Nocardioides sp. NPDC087217]|uniref:MaoC/PaaZ C-terminal domain-containing protein n=1 Tax=Nocardioides sp. NPDC087217 TaxID=3364335 RepID=UPI003802C254